MTPYLLNLTRTTSGLTGLQRDFLQSIRAIEKFYTCAKCQLQQALIRDLFCIWFGGTSSTLNQNTLSLSLGSEVLAVYINLIVCPRLASIRDTGGVAVKGTVILPGSALSSPVSNQLWTSNGLFPLFSRRTLTLFDRFYILREYPK